MDGSVPLTNESAQVPPEGIPGIPEASPTPPTIPPPVEITPAVPPQEPATAVLPPPAEGGEKPQTPEPPRSAPTTEAGAWGQENNQITQP